MSQNQIKDGNIRAEHFRRNEEIIASMTMEEKEKVRSLLQKLKATRHISFTAAESTEDEYKRWEELDVMPISMIIFEKIILTVLWYPLNTSRRYGHSFQRKLNDDITLDVWKIRLNSDINKNFVGKANTEEYNEWRNAFPFKNNLKDEPTLFFFQTYVGGGKEDLKKLGFPIIILDLPHNSSGDGIGHFINQFPEGMIEEIHPCIKYVDGKPVSFLSIVFDPMIMKILVKFSESEFEDGTDVIRQHWYQRIVSQSEIEYICYREDSVI